MTLTHIFKTTPPTGQFKGPSDAAGNDTKLKVSRLERDGVVRCTDGWEVFLALEEYFPEPINNSNTFLKRFHINKRHFRYVVKESMKTEKMQLNPHVVTLIQPHGENLAKTWLVFVKYIN